MSENLQVTVRVEQDVGRLEVAVQHICRVDVLQPSGDDGVSFNSILFQVPMKYVRQVNVLRPSDDDGDVKFEHKNSPEF